MRLEPWALGTDGRWSPVNPEMAAAPRGSAAGLPSDTVLLAAFCDSLDSGLAPGDVVLGSELHGPSRTVACVDPAILAGVLRRAGLRVRVGPIALDAGSSEIVSATQGAEAVTVAGVVAGARPREGHDAVLRSLQRLRALAPGWARARGAREVVLAAPRASCAGVNRAIEVVERALEQRGAPVYVRRQIVHNAHVVESLEARGAIFVEEIDEVPAGATVIFSAHGVSPAVRAHAAARGLDVIDATCPLVAKVHREARRYAAAGLDIVLVGHRGHDEVEGTVGEASERMHVIAGAADVDGLRVADPERVAYLTQTTLAVDETADTIRALRERFPGLRGPAASDICYATQNRQDAVRAVASSCEMMLVVGSPTSSNSRRLVEVAARAGCPAHLIERGSDILPEWLTGVSRVGLTAGASAPEALVDDVVSALDGVGGVSTMELEVAREDLRFTLPPEVRS